MSDSIVAADVAQQSSATAIQIDIEEVKKHIQQVRDSVDSDVAAINTAKTKFESLQDAAQTKFEEFQDGLNELQKKIAAATKMHDELTGLNSEVQATKDAADSAKQSVDADVQSITTSKTAFETLKTETQERAQELQDEQVALKSKIDAVTQAHDAVTKLHANLLVSEKDAEGKVTKICVEDAVNLLHSKMKEQFSATEEKRKAIETEFSDLRKSLEAEILSLLPRAGAAGLAHAYFDSKGRYGFVPYKPQKDANRFWSFVCGMTHYTGKALTAIFHYTLFILPIIAIFDLFVGKFFFNSPIDLAAADVEETLVFRMMIAAPLAVLSYFGFSSIRLNRRMYEEYNHKQRVMELYHSFKPEIEAEENGDGDLKQKLLVNMLEVVKGKPSLVMAKYDGGGLAGFINALRGNTATLDKKHQEET